MMARIAKWAEEVEHFVAMFAGLVGRALAVDWISGAGLYRVTVVQRCRACRDEIATAAELSGSLSSAAITGLRADWQAVLGHAIRFAYDSHQCPPVDSILHGCTSEEWDELIMSTEREMLRCGERVAALQAAFREKLVDRDG